MEGGDVEGLPNLLYEGLKMDNTNWLQCSESEALWYCFGVHLLHIAGGGAWGGWNKLC